MEMLEEELQEELAVLQPGRRERWPTVRKAMPSARWEEHRPSLARYSLRLLLRSMLVGPSALAGAVRLLGIG